MSMTNYDYETILKFRKKYKWIRWLYQICCPVILILLFLRLRVMIPDRYDTIGYYTSETEYHYLFGIKSCIINLIFIFACIIIYIVIPYIIKKFLKEDYIQFLVARYNRNIKYPKSKKVYTIIYIIIFFIIILSFGSINSITVTNESFVVKQNIIFLSNTNTKKYDFDYFENHRVYRGMSNGSIAFYKADDNGIYMDFQIGQYSPKLIEFLGVIEKKTNYKYCLLENI